MAFTYLWNLCKKPRGHDIILELRPQINGTTENDNEPISNDRKHYLPQNLATIALNLEMFLLGIAYSFPMMLSPSQSKNDSSWHSYKCFVADTDETTFRLTFMFFFQAIGSVISGYALDKLGRKQLIMLINYPFLFGWIILLVVRKRWQRILTQATMCGLSGSIEVAVITYVSEISLPETRNTLIAYSNAFKNLGIFVGSILTNFMGWHEVVMLAVFVEVVSVFIISLVPESPVWLLMMGKKKQAEEALCWLRGRDNPADVASELKECSHYVTTSSSVETETGEAMIINNNPTSLRRDRFWPNMFKSMGCALLLFFVTTSNGYVASTSQMLTIVKDLKMPLSDCAVPLVFDFTAFLGALFCLLTVRHFSRKLVIMVSLLCVALFSCKLLVFKEELALGCFLFIIFFSNYGLQGPLMSIMVEFLPFKRMGIIFGISISIFYFCNINGLLMFLFINEYFSTPTMFLLYAIINAFNIYFMYLIMPEKENLSLSKIKQNA